MGIMDLFSGNMPEEERAYKFAQLSDAFGSLRDNGGGPRRSPAALKALKSYQRNEKARAALLQAQGGEGLPMGFNSPQFQAYAESNPEQALQLMAQEAIKGPGERKSFKGADGYQYYADGTRVLPGVVKEEKSPTAQSAIAKLAQDLSNGLISQEDFVAGRAKLLEGKPQGPLSALGKLKADFDAGRIGESEYELGVKKATGIEGMEMVSDGAGGFTFRQGVGVGGSDAPTAIKTEAIKGRNAYDSIMKGLSDYERISASGGAVIPGEKKDSLDVARRSLQLQMKELFNLGVLNGPDLALMDQLLVDMTSLENNALDITGVAPLEGRNKANIAQLRQMMTDLIEPKLRSAGQPPTGAAPAPAGPRKTIGGVTYEQRNGKWGVLK